MTTQLTADEENRNRRMYSDLTSCCVPVLLGPATQPQNATASVLRIADRLVVVTCKHVVDEFRRLRNNDERAAFQVGNWLVDPIESLIDESSSLDLTSFLISDSSTFRGDGYLGYQVDSLPSSPITTEDVVGFAGFPQRWRDLEKGEDVTCGGWVTTACPDESAGEGYFYLRFELEECETLHTGPARFERVCDPVSRLLAVGGISGGPVLAHRRTGTELAGFVVEYQDSLDLLFVRSASVLAANGMFVEGHA